MAETETETETETTPALEQPGRELEQVADEHLPAATEPAPGLLPGEVRPHPSPLKYVTIAVVLVVVTAAEVWVSYLDEVLASGLIIVLLLLFGFLKFTMVAAWYMHLRTDKPIFRRFFALGVAAAISLYLIVLLTLDVFSE
ncbi:MAG: cytochrome C oxidase subunit IV family protein [Acidimicrobiia bacterium]